MGHDDTFEFSFGSRFLIKIDSAILRSGWSIALYSTVAPIHPEYHRHLDAHGYSRSLLKRLLREVYSARGTKHRQTQSVGEDGYLTLPYIDGRLLCKVKNIVNPRLTGV